MSKEYSRDVWNATQRANHLQRESARRAQEAKLGEEETARKVRASTAADKVASLIDLEKW